MLSRILPVRLAATLAMLALVPALALAETQAQSVEIGGAVTYIRLDRQTELESRFAPTVFVGYNFTKRHGGEIAFTSTAATPDHGESISVDIDILRLGYVYNAYPREKMVSFFRFGTGVWASDPDEEGTGRLSGSDSNFMLYAGGGLRYFLRESLALRIGLSVDFIQTGGGVSDYDVQGTGEVGLSFVLGGRDETAAPKEAVPAPTEAVPVPQ